MLILHGEAVVSPSITATHSRHVLYKNTCRPSITISGNAYMSGAIAGCLFVYSRIMPNGRDVARSYSSQTTGGKTWHGTLHVHGTPLHLRPAQDSCAAVLCTGSVANPLVSFLNARRSPHYTDTDAFIGTSFCVKWPLDLSLHVKDAHGISRVKGEPVSLTSRKPAPTISVHIALSIHRDNTSLMRHDCIIVPHLFPYLTVPRLT